MSCPTTDITIIKGKTFEKILRWESKPLVYKAITDISQSAPVAIEATAHGLPDGWRAAVVSVQGMREINAKSGGKGRVPLASDFLKVTVVDPNNITINDINALEFSAYESGGALVYYTPVSLSGASARLQIRATEESEEVLLDIDSTAEIDIDDTDKKITITIASGVTEALEFSSGVYELEVTVGGKVHQLLKGNVIVVDEVVRD